jgi:hypothetical protein
MTTRVLAALFVLVLSAPAYAQNAPTFDVSGGYSFLRDEENFHGWLASITGNVTPVFGITGEVGGNYKSIDNVDVDLHSYMVGPRFASRQNPSVTPFVHVLFGGVRVGEEFAGLSDSTTEFALQPGAGVDFWANPNFGLRVGADYRRVFYEGYGSNQFRFNVGVVLAGGRR